jgi:hypothetical protein
MAQTVPPCANATLGESGGDPIGKHLRNAVLCTVLSCMSCKSHNSCHLAVQRRAVRFCFASWKLLNNCPFVWHVTRPADDNARQLTNASAAAAAVAIIATGVPDAGCSNSTSAYCLNVTGIICRYSLRPSSTVCRDKAGDCDVAEQCSGTAADCPADSLLSNATVCRLASGLVPEQKCTGTSAACPGYGSNVNCTAQTVQTLPQVRVCKSLWGSATAAAVFLPETFCQL